MGGEIDLFRSFISKKGLRNTPEREEIIAEIFSNPNHFDVDELYLRLKRNGSKISKASIYRNIPLIMECGLIKEVWFEDGHTQYEQVYGQRPHCHLRCLGCGKIIEVVEPEMKDLEAKIGRENDFKIVDQRLDITGYCSKCRDMVNSSIDEE